MPRQARKDLNTPFLHVMLQGVNKEYIFYKDEYIERYIDLIMNIKKNFDFTIIAYCIMNNHAHFLVHTENIKEFGKFMQKSNLLYAQMYNKEENRCGVLFRNRYQTEPIYNIKYLINCIKYIHNNPIKANIVKKCEDYKYSSYKDYIYNTGVTKSKIMEELFGKNCDYMQLFKNTLEKRYMDINSPTSDITKQYLLDGIREFKNTSNIQLYELLSNRILFKKMIHFLKEECGFKYVEIMDFFEIPRGTLDSLKII